MNQSKIHTDVNSDLRKHKRAGALLTAAAGAIALLLGAKTVTGQAAPTTAPTTQSSGGMTADSSIHLYTGKSVVVPLTKIYAEINRPSAEFFTSTFLYKDDNDKTPPFGLLITAKKPGSSPLVLWEDQDHQRVIDITAEQDLSALRNKIKESFPNLDVTLAPLNDTIAIHGHVPSMQTSEQIIEMASTYAKVHNFMEISGGQQVMLQVRLAEVDKSALRSLGVTFGGVNGTGPEANTLSVLGSATPISGATANIFGGGEFGSVTFNYFVSALRQNNLLRDLAEPNLLAASGQQASFLAGGQIPVPVPQPGNGGSTITIEYHPFGVSLNFTPQVLGNGRIRLLVAPEVSELDYSHAVSVSGTTVPGFTDRKLSTSVELGDGQSFALGGLLQSDVVGSTTSVPLLGDIPVLGALFRSTSYQRSETELVVLVTPHLVSAMNPDQVTTLPGEHWRHPNEFAQYFLNDLGGPVAEKPKAMDKKLVGPAPEFHGTYGFSADASGMPQKADNH